MIGAAGVRRLTIGWSGIHNLDRSCRSCAIAASHRLSGLCPAPRTHRNAQFCLTHKWAPAMLMATGCLTPSGSSQEYPMRTQEDPATVVRTFSAPLILAPGSFKPAASVALEAASVPPGVPTSLD